ncbi:hypothetical protein [Methylobacterium sp. E-066]|uniref:hypothetical protein n=1 Tax=Methylobacterium sp. E-066 TaxID=2836584 RepID=UPI001FBAFD2A|nr:hypothetical protein [Methylobacterium sp. E-066]MCJ2144270.1 hypothetical protein [Methylobacterium sp. E-066]
MVANADEFRRIQLHAAALADDRVEIARRHPNAERDRAIRPYLDRLRLDRVEMDEPGEASPVTDARH